MTVIDTVLLVAGSLLLMTTMIKLMARANAKERDVMQRRREEWIAGGSNPDDEPNFFTGNGGGTFS